MPIRSNAVTTALRAFLLLLAACAVDTPQDAGLDGGGPAIDATAGDAPFFGDAAMEDITPAPDAGPLRPRERVLLIGNSYTTYNGLPGLLAELGDASRTPLDIEVAAQGGATLDVHWNGAAAGRIDEGFDAVVMQGQSLEWTRPEFDEHAQRFADAIATAGSRGVWYAHWARQDIELDSRRGTTLIEEAYARAADLHDDEVARVGEAFLIANLLWPELTLIGADRSHPTPAGSLMAACVIYRAITGRAPALPESIAGLSPGDARALCAIADEGVPCDAGESLCGAECVVWSPMTCGGCDIECADGDPCRDGVCGCPDESVGCDGRCVDTVTSPANCGACGRSCGLLGRCDDSACSCPASGEFRSFDFPVDAGCVDGEAESVECKSLAHRRCREVGGELGCFSSGFGPPSGHSAEGNNRVHCVDSDIVETSAAALALIVPECEAASASQACTTAIHRFCRARGAVSGFGPVTITGDVIVVSCLSAGTVLRLAASDVGASRCLADPVGCSIAAWGACAARGHTSGFGPVEVIGEEVEITCLDEE